MSGVIRVLHVDDEPSYGDLVSDFLEREDERLAVHTETSARDGLDYLRNETTTVDCIVSDYDMPGMDGLEFLEAVRDERPAVPFILFTGKGSEAVASEAISAGATDYLQKQTGTEQYELLANRIENAVEQQEAKRAERWLGELAAATNRILYVLSADWDELLFVNSAYEELWGRSIEDFRADPLDFIEGVHPDHREKVRDGMAALSAGESIDLEYPVNPGENYDRWVRVRGEPITDEEGNIVRVAGFATEITEKKERERELRRAERRFEAILEDPNILAGLLDTDGRVLSANDTALSYIDADEAAVIGEPIWETPWWTEEMREGIKRRVERAAAGEYVKYDLDVPRADDAPYSFTGVIRPVTDDDGEIVSLIISANDVTEHRQQERQLEEAEMLFQHSQDALFLVDIGDDEYTIQRVNPAYEAATGLSSDAVEGKRPTEVFGEEHGANVAANYRECETKREPLQYEEELLIAGETTYWETRIAPVVIDGEVPRLVGSTRNVTGRKERDRERRRNERRFETMFDDPNILVGLLEPDGTVIDINETAMTYIGQDLDDVVGDLFWETPWVSPEMRPVVTEKVAQAAAGEYVEYSGTQTDAHGEPYSLAGVIRPVVDDGEVISLIVSARDVTEREKRDRILDAILENTTSLLFLKDREGRYLLVNEGFRDRLGFADEEILGKTDEELLPPAQARELTKNDHLVIDREEAVETEEVVDTDGEKRVYMSSKVPVYDIGTRSDPDSPVAVFGVATEITEQKRRESELERQNERFDELASVISHDLQNPLETARGRVELAYETGDVEHLETALDAFDRANALKDDVVEMLRKREIVGDTEPVDVGAVAESTWQTLDTPGDASLTVVDAPRVEASPDAVNRLIENLVLNAVEHGNGSTSVEVGGLEGGFYVEDDGGGIPREHREDVFTPGYSTKAGSGGIGMASVRQIVEAHDWEIEIRDGERLDGTRFEIFTG